MFQATPGPTFVGSPIRVVRLVTILVLLAAAIAVVAACSGETGATGAEGPQGSVLMRSSVQSTSCPARSIKSLR